MKILRRTLRALLRLWYRTGRKCGWHYQFLLSHGGSLSEAAPLLTRLPNGARIHCDLHDQIPRLIFFEGVYEPPEAYLFHRLLQPGWTFIDVGANIGQYTLLAAPALGPRGAIFAFEPVPATARRLRENVALNQFDRVQVEEIALWHESGWVPLGLAAKDANILGGYSAGVRSGENELAGECTVAAMTFDDFAATRGIARVDLVKMDIEGAELYALHGMVATLRRDHPLLLMEVSRPNADRMGTKLSAIWDLLAGELQYHALSIGVSAAECVPLPHLEGVFHKNVLFYPGSLPDDLLRGWTFPDALRWGRSGWDR